MTLMEFHREGQVFWFNAYSVKRALGYPKGTYVKDILASVPDEWKKEIPDKMGRFTSNVWHVSTEGLQFLADNARHLLTEDSTPCEAQGEEKITPLLSEGLASTHKTGKRCNACLHYNS